MKTFRLIQSGFCDAVTNMAIDEALVLSYRQGISLPTLRLYGWRPAAFSLGYSQIPEKVLDLDACRQEGISFVRRPTGGGALFHDKELTYSVILSASDIGTGRDVKAGFEKITSFLIAAYTMLGLGACFAKDHGLAGSGGIADFCFSRKEEYDILVAGRKLGGNAQRRKKDIILQHGSIPFTFDKNRVRRFLKDQEALDSLDVTSLDEAAGGRVDFKSLSDALIEAFRQI